MKEGQVERIDPEYIRHGTSGIIATGKIVAPMVQPTCTEEDFAKHINDIITININDSHIFIADNLNTHKSEALVRLIAVLEGIDGTELGIKGKYGILKNQASREAFLSDYSHNKYRISVSCGLTVMAKG